MKKITMALAAASMLLSCSNEPEEVVTVKADEPSDTMQAVTLTFSFPQMEMKAMTRGTLSESSLTDLWLFDFMGEELKQTIHHASTDDGFGSVAVTAETGEHRFCFVASRGSEAVVDGGVITWGKPSDTFWQNVILNVTPQTATAQAVELQRVATRLRISITDEVPTTLKKLSVVADTWYCGLDAKTGQPTAATSRTATINVPASYVGTTGSLAASIFGLCGDDYTTNVSVTALDASDAAIATVSLDDVPMARNTTTNYSGPLFTRQPTFSLTTADDWGEEVTMTW